ncbi:MAG: hypothetical protein ABII88_02975 [Candidatus Omnitrophota bacterium]
MGIWNKLFGTNTNKELKQSAQKKEIKTENTLPPKRAEDLFLKLLTIEKMENGGHCINFRNDVARAIGELEHEAEIVVPHLSMMLNLIPAEEIVLKELVPIPSINLLKSVLKEIKLTLRKIDSQAAREALNQYRNKKIETGKCYWGWNLIESSKIIQDVQALGKK